MMNVVMIVVMEIAQGSNGRSGGAIPSSSDKGRYSVSDEVIT